MPLPTDADIRGFSRGVHAVDSITSRAATVAAVVVIVALALPQADDRFVHVEASADEELEALEHRHVETHAAVRADDAVRASDEQPR